MVRAHLGEPIIKWGFSSFGRASALQAEGEEFESPNLHHTILGESMEDLEVAIEQEAPAIEESTVDPLAELQKELAEVKDQYLRARAETENQRKRNAEELTKARKFAVERFAEDLIAVSDSLYAAVEVSDSQGLQLTLKQLKSVFERHQMKEINPAIGDDFDPHQHQAISAVESEQKENTVLSVLQRGYILADRVLRPAMVTVSKIKQEEIADGKDINVD